MEYQPLKYQPFNYQPLNYQGGVHKAYAIRIFRGRLSAAVMGWDGDGTGWDETKGACEFGG